MIKAAIPYVTTGIALVGTSTLAIAPIKPAPADVRAADPVVQLAAIPSPLELYPRVIVTTFGFADNLAQTYSDNPFPIISTTVEIQVASLVEAGAALADGDGAAAFAAITDAIMQPIESLSVATDYLRSLLNQPDIVSQMVAVSLAPVRNGIAAAGAAMAQVVEAVLAFDLIGAFNAVVNIPALIIDGVLNGGYSSGAEYWSQLPGPGLLNPVHVGPGVGGILPFGPIGMAIALNREAAYEISVADHNSKLANSDASAAVSAAVDDPSNVAATALPSDSDPWPAGQGLPEAPVEDVGQDDAATAAAGGVAADATSGIDTPTTQAPLLADAELDTSDDSRTAVTDQADEELGTTDDGLIGVVDQADEEELSEALDAAIAESPAGATDRPDGNKVTPGEPLSDTKPATGASQDAQEPAAGSEEAPSNPFHSSGKFNTSQPVRAL